MVEKTFSLLHFVKSEYLNQKVWNRNHKKIQYVRHWLLLLAAFVCVGGSGVQAGPHDAFGSLLGVVGQARSGTVDTETDGEDAAGPCATANSCYVSEVEPVVQESCAMCHQQGLTADQQGARLLFTDDPAKNHAALETFVTSDGIGADWLLGKIVGDFGHGGGPVLAQGSNSYWAFADYLTLLVGANTDDGSVEASAIWAGTVMESREDVLLITVEDVTEVIDRETL